MREEMRAVLKTKCGAAREIDVAVDNQGRPLPEVRVPILLSQPKTAWGDIEVSPFGPTYCHRTFRCEYREDEDGRLIYSEYCSAESMTEQERWDANLEWPPQIALGGL